MEKVIEVKDLCFRYSEELILHNVSFSVDKGDFLGVIGPNGSGKSTLARLLLGLLKPVSGEIRILGESIDKFKKWSKLGYMSQKAASFNTSFPATVEEIVSANLYSKVGIFRRPNKHHKEFVDNALSVVGMQDNKNKLIGNLSGGQQQRVFIARILVSQPEIVFLDEPTVGVDARSEEAVYCLLAKLNNKLGLTVVMVTHDIGAVTAHANKIACMGNKNLIIHEPGKGQIQDYISDLYGYEVNLHIHKHNCDNCCRKERDHA